MGVESLKPILLLLVLGGVGYSVYVALNHAPPPEPATTGPEWSKPPALDPGVGNRPIEATSQSSSTSPNSASAPTNNPWQFGSAAGDSRAMPASPAEKSPPLSNSGNISSPTAPFSSGRAKNQITSPGGAPEITHAAGSDSASADHSPNLGTPNADAPNLGSPNVGSANSATPNSAPTNSGANAEALYKYESSKRTALTLLKQGKLVEALRELSQWYGQTVVPSEDEPHMLELLSQLAGTVIYSREPWLEPHYEVRAGDSLESIAQQYQVPWQLLAKINGIQDPNSLMPGEKLKIVRGPFQARLNVTTGWLAVFADGLYAGRFKVESAGPLIKPDGSYPVAKFTDDSAGGGQAPYISFGGDLHLRVFEDNPPSGVAAVRISRQDMADVFDILSERSQVTILR
jgi:hypothetical protein